MKASLDDLMWAKKMVDDIDELIEKIDQVGPDIIEDLTGERPTRPKIDPNDPAGLNPTTNGNRRRRPNRNNVKKKSKPVSSRQANDPRRGPGRSRRSATIVRDDDSTDDELPIIDAEFTVRRHEGRGDEPRTPGRKDRTSERSQD